MMSVCTTAALSEAFVASGFCAGALPIEIQQPRTIISLGATDYLALERATNSVVLGEDLNGDGIPESIRTLVSLPGLTHGLALSSTHLYASKSTEVYRWPFNATTKAIALDAQETVIQNMNANGQGGAPFGHTTRSLAVKEGSSNGTTGLELYVSVGSNENVDPDSFRARIRRFPLDDPTKFPIGTRHRNLTTVWKQSMVLCVMLVLHHSF